MVHKFEQPGSPEDQVGSSLPPGVMDEVIRHQMSGNGRPENFNVAYNGDGGMTIGDGFRPKTPEEFGTYTAAYQNLPENGIGSKADVADAMDWHKARCPQAHDMHSRIATVLSA